MLQSFFISFSLLTFFLTFNFVKPTKRKCSVVVVPGGNFTDIPNDMSYYQPMTPLSAARLRRGYAASVSYTDANIGKMMAVLDASPRLKAETVVVLIGDVSAALPKPSCRPILGVFLLTLCYVCVSARLSDRVVHLLRT